MPALLRYGSSASPSSNGARDSATSAPVLLAQGRPVMFRSKGGNPAARVEVTDSGRCRITALNGTPVQVNGSAVTAVDLRSGDMIAVGKEAFQFRDDGPEVIEPASATPLPGIRNSRKLSVTHSATVPKTQTSGLLTKVSAAFNTKDKARLAGLELERRNLLQDAGLASLLNGGLGLAADKLSTVLRGEVLSVSYHDLDPIALEQWRRRRRRLAELDAAIASVRRTLGMPAHTEHLVPVAPAGSAKTAEAALGEASTQPIEPPSA